MEDIIKRARFMVTDPYAVVRCVDVYLIASGGMDSRGQTLMRVRFKARAASKRVLGCPTQWGRRVAWETDGFAGSPLHADDSEATMCSAVTLALHCGAEDAVLPDWLSSVRESIEADVCMREERLRG